MNAFCRASWDLPISLSRSFSACLSEAMSLQAVDRSELGLRVLFVHLARVRGHENAQCVVQLRCLLVQLAHFGRQRLDLGVLGDVVGCLPRLLAKVAQGAELLNVGGV